MCYGLETQNAIGMSLDLHEPDAVVGLQGMGNVVVHIMVQPRLHFKRHVQTFSLEADARLD